MRLVYCRDIWRAKAPSVLDSPALIEMDKSLFNKMPYCPFGIKGRMWDAYPRLSHKRALCRVPKEDFDSVDEVPPTEADLDNLLKFVALMAVRTVNPLAGEKDWDLRIKTAAGLVGIAEGGLLWKIIDSRHWWFNGVLCEFFRMMNDDDYQLWVSSKLAISEQLRFLSSALGESEGQDIEKAILTKAKLPGLISGQIAELRKLESKLFPTEELLELLAQDAWVDDDLAGWPERFALTYPY